MSKTSKPNPERPDQDKPRMDGGGHGERPPCGAAVLPELMGEDAWQRLLSYGQERVRKLGLTEADVERMIAEYRREAKERKR